jgi:lipoprotein-anchoring transpeptidase ErfK/SrfK
MRNPAIRLGLILAVLATGFAACKADRGQPLAQIAKPATTTTAAPVTTVVRSDGVPPATPFALAAYATVPKVTVYEAPDAPKVKTVMTNPTIEKVQLAMFAGDRRGDWLHVRLPMRPNGSEGWVRASEVHLQEMQTRIVVDVSDRKLRVLDRKDATIFEAAVAVGKPSTPTALGRTFVDVWLPSPGRPYGAFLLSVGAFSEVLRNFAGGRGQQAIHGWADPSAMGKNVSNGCIRMRNDDVMKVAELAPLGTPVDIVA